MLAVGARPVMFEAYQEMSLILAYERSRPMLNVFVWMMVGSSCPKCN